jgi:hypothetical protein
MALRVEILGEDGTPRKLKATRLVVYDEATDNPISLVIEFHPGAYYTSQVGDDDFNSLLENLGVNKTMLVDTLDIKGK